MDEKRLSADEAELQRPEEAIMDLEPDERHAEAVVGGLKVDGISGESQKESNY